MAQLIGYCLLLSVLSSLKACLSSPFSKHWDSSFSLFIVICLWLWSAGSQSSDSAEIEWEILCPNPSASAEEPLSSCSIQAPLWHKQLRTVIFQARTQVLIFHIPQACQYRKSACGVHSFHQKVQGKNTICCWVGLSRAFQDVPHNT